MMDFFQTLSTCHTVQVVAEDVDIFLAENNEFAQGNDELEDDAVMDDQCINSIKPSGPNAPESLQMVTQFQDIREESEYEYKKSFEIFVYGNILGPESIPSLIQIHQEFDEQTNDMVQCVICKSILSKTHFSGTNLNAQLCNECSTSRLRPRNGFMASSPVASRLRLPRPMSSEFKRAISYVDGENNKKMSHRRTQSYVPQTTYDRQMQISEIQNASTNISNIILCNF